MKKCLFTVLSLLSCLSVIGCTTHYAVNDIESIRPLTVDINTIKIPMKDFNVIQPVFAQTTVNVTHEVSEISSGSSLSNQNYNTASGESENLRKVSTSGSYIIARRLLDEAFKVGADATANVHIEYELYCHEQSTSEITESEFDAQALLAVASGVVNVAGTAAGSAGTMTAASHTESASKIAPKIKTQSSSFEGKTICTLTIYGNALAIKYTDAIIPTCHD